MVKKVSIILGVSVISIAATLFAQSFGASPSLSPRDHVYINAVVDSQLSKHFIINFQPLRKSFVDIARRYQQKTYVYFAYLNNAAWVGLNEREMFVAASLVKVPLAMAVYNAIEESKLEADAVYGLEDVNINEQFGTEHGLSDGETITVEELLKIMLVKSDNTAANALYTILQRIGIDDPLNDVYDAMGWEFADPGVAENYGLIHVKVLSNMFLSLYNATYVNPEHSQRILAYLTQTEFDQEIEAGVPTDIPVAHKIGIYEVDRVYSDCGIVYAPNREYILCVASSGASQESARKFIAEISRAAYQYVMNN